ncbi:hypothetical protein F383_36819 [Gossypium arboreum]|uniref:Uncharacterized protein n=1 Tax=Gossypium arboreum TaxID=29729 RepID=A0A0B0MAQ2_GOSAR|nr:hypothetical protein F383_36819 [Gossypium arboreum]
MFQFMNSIIVNDATYYRICTQRTGFWFLIYLNSSFYLHQIIRVKHT